jgi:hypothetical protein
MPQLRSSSSFPRRFASLAAGVASPIHDLLIVSLSIQTLFSSICYSICRLRSPAQGMESELGNLSPAGSSCVSSKLFRSSISASLKRGYSSRPRRTSPGSVPAMAIDARNLTFVTLAAVEVIGSFDAMDIQDEMVHVISHPSTPRGLVDARAATTSS